MTQSFDFHCLFLKLCDQEARAPSFEYVYSLFPAYRLLLPIKLEPTHTQQNWEGVLLLRVLAP